MGLTLTDLIVLAAAIVTVVYYGPKAFLNILAFFKVTHLSYQSLIANTRAFFLQRRGFKLCDQGKYKEAIKCYDEAIDLVKKPSNAPPDSISVILIWKGDALCKLGKYDEAQYCFDKSIHLDPKAWAWNHKGGCFLKQDKYAEAIYCYDKATEINPKYAIAWYNKGNAYKKLGRNTDADSAFAKAKELGYKDNSGFFESRRSWRDYW